MKPTAIPEHIGWSTAFNINCEKHHDYAGNGRCPECLAQEIERLKAELAESKTLAEETRDAIKVISKECLELQDDNHQLREGLRRLEWSAEVWQHRIHKGTMVPQSRLVKACYVCQKAEDQGHKPDCWLSALLGEGRE